MYKTEVHYDIAMIAIQAVRRMMGGAQAQLVRIEDGSSWVVKFQNNTQGTRILANEFIATRLAKMVGLAVPESGIVEVPQSVAKDMHILLPGQGRTLCKPGLHFGSRFVIDDHQDEVKNYLPEHLMEAVENIEEFAGMLCLDKWTGNSDGRQAVFLRRPGHPNHKAYFIDQGNCFNAAEWSFPDHPLRGVCSKTSVYRRVTGWDSFEPWLSRFEDMTPRVIWDLARSVPTEWYGSNHDSLDNLMQELIKRRCKIRSLIENFRSSNREPFPLWQEDRRDCVRNMHEPAECLI